MCCRFVDDSRSRLDLRSASAEAVHADARRDKHQPLLGCVGQCRWPGLGRLGPPPGAARAAVAAAASSCGRHIRAYPAPRHVARAVGLHCKGRVDRPFVGSGRSLGSIIGCLASRFTGSAVRSLRADILGGYSNSSAAGCRGFDRLCWATGRQPQDGGARRECGAAAGLRPRRALRPLVRDGAGARRALPPRVPPVPALARSSEGRWGSVVGLRAPAAGRMAAALDRARLVATLPQRRGLAPRAPAGGACAAGGCGAGGGGDVGGVGGRRWVRRGWDGGRSRVGGRHLRRR
mmetsp:Transcript_100972/g.324167  ORF Transcript_100972/g.324167 Transcript_100972/m.324167 type:complete len:291 (+) Transcript_100972:624-1496(+)